MVKRNADKAASTVAARLDGFVDEASAGVVPAMQASTTFLRDEQYNLVRADNSYGRDDNDQVRLAERVLCKLEGGADTLLFASGMAAIAALLASLKSGDKLLLQSGIYWGTTSWARRYCARQGITLLEADAQKTQKFCEIISTEKPNLVFIEVPSNPWIRLSDIEVIAGKVHDVDGFFAVDATAATPLLLRPLSLGADIVVHSATKAINGHSDVLAGVLSCSDSNSDVWQFAMQERSGAGAILSAQSAWLLLRGIRTLPLRIEKMCANAFEIANFLHAHSAVEEVWYPGLASHEDHQLANELMDGGYGYLMSFLIKGGKQEALAFCSRLEGIHRATSLGGTESLVEHRHTIEGDLTNCPENLIRLSVGIEDAGDLIAELNAAL